MFMVISETEVCLQSAWEFFVENATTIYLYLFNVVKYINR